MSQINPDHSLPPVQPACEREGGEEGGREEGGREGGREEGGREEGDGRKEGGKREGGRRYACVNTSDYAAQSDPRPNLSSFLPPPRKRLLSS